MYLEFRRNYEFRRVEVKDGVDTDKDKDGDDDGVVADHGPHLGREVRRELELFERERHEEGPEEEDDGEEENVGRVGTGVTMQNAAKSREKSVAQKITLYCILSSYASH